VRRDLPSPRSLTQQAPDEPELLRQRKRVRSQMNLYGPEAVERLRQQDFEEFTDLVIEREEERRARWAKHPELSEKIRKLAVG
jgi:hypothetical protein